MQDLSSFNSFGLHVHAQNLVRICSEADLKNCPSDHALILGRGSDILLTDDYEGTVLVNCISSLDIRHEGDRWIVRSGGGMELDSLIETLIARNIPGLENLSAIPGTVGAAPIQNVGAYGAEVGEHIVKIEYFDLDRRCFGSLSHDECEFGYRTSFFKKHPELRYFVTAVTFSLAEKFVSRLTYKGLAGEALDTPYKVREKVIALRRSKLPDPAQIGNAGSFFKNPEVSEDKAADLRRSWPDMPVYPQSDGTVKLAAGWLIDKAGCRGITHGRAGTWENQALVIVNRGGARPHEIVALAKYVQMEVMNTFGISLEPEVRIYGKTGEISWDQI
jgi:UDP-N-acetylmuramate dehydrogenase